MWGSTREIAHDPRVVHVRARAAQAYPSRTHGDSVVGTRKEGRFPACRPSDGRLDGGPGQPARPPPTAVKGTATDPFARQAHRPAIHPDTCSRQAIRFFSLERVFGATFRKQLPLS